jgi:hypothetical protein
MQAAVILPPLTGDAIVHRRLERCMYDWSH